ncbi:MAG: histidine kinase, partial [Saprospiraceae bacterium]|nr:histidine kinase [Saprospiraceae bacterium]
GGIWLKEKLNINQRLCKYEKEQWTCYEVDSLSIFYDRWKERIIGFNQKKEIYTFDPGPGIWKYICTLQLPSTYEDHLISLLNVLKGEGYYINFSSKDRVAYFHINDLITNPVYTYFNHQKNASKQEPVSFQTVLRHAQALGENWQVNLTLHFLTANGLVPALDNRTGKTVKYSSTPYFDHTNIYFIGQDDDIEHIHYIYRYLGENKMEKVASYSNTVPHLGFCRSADGNFWIAGQNGLLKVNPNILTCFEDQPNMVSALHNINQDPKGNIWFGGYKTGLAEFDGSTLRKTGPTEYQSIMPGSHHTDSTMYFFDERFGLVSYDGGTWLPSGRNVKPLGYSSTETGYVIKPLSNNRIGLGLTRIGFAILDGSGPVTQPWKIIGKDKGFGLVNVIALTEDKNHRIWLGRSSTGVALYDPELDTVRNWLVSDFPRLGSGFRGSHLDDQENLWLGKSDGLYWLEDPDQVKISDTTWIDRLFKIPFQGIQNQMVSYIFQKNNYLIFGHENGHALLDLPSFYQDHENPRIFDFNTANPSQGGGAEQNAYLIDRSGNIWLGKQNGAIRINLETLTLDTLPEKIVLDSLYAGDEKIEIKGSEVRLPIAKRNIQLWFHTVFNGNLNDLLTFSYEVSNDAHRYFDQKRTEKVKYINFSYLPTGRNQIIINTFKNNQIVDQLRLKLIVPKTLMESTAFWITSILTTVGLIIAFIIYRQKQTLLIKQKELELSKTHREKEKLQIAAIANSLNPHFINNSLSWLQWAMPNDKKGIQVISRLAENIKMVFQKSRDGKAFHNLIDEFTIVRNYLTIQQIRYGEYFRISLPSDSEIEKFKSLMIPLMQIQIHVENAIEHGLRNDQYAKLIDIKIKDEEFDVHITITDDGVGREKAGKLKSSGTGKGIEMLKNLHDIFNSINERPILSWYDDCPLVKENGEKCGTRVHIIIPKIYHYAIDEN